MIRAYIAAAIVAAMAACTQPVPGNDGVAGGPQPGQPAAGNQQDDWAAIERLEEQAKGLAIATGCTTTDQCRTAPVGNRACGGPRYYLVYCAASTDSAALFAKLDEIVAAENAYNHRYDIVSTCEFRMPPELSFSGGECRAAP